MIIRRKLKLFARRVPFPSDLAAEFSLPVVEALRGNTGFLFEYSGTYTDQRSKQTPGNCDIIDKLIEDIDDNYLFFDGPAGGDTHWLADESGTGSNPPFVTFSKKINDEDRLNYRIYKPERDPKTGKYIQKIVMSSCEDHSLNGKPGAYVKGQIGNTWHPKKNSKRKHGKNK